MTVFRYPQNDFDDSERLLGLLGSFWATAYQGNSLLEDLAGTTGQMAQQSHLQLLELVCSVSRYSVPIFHQSSWYSLRILESELNSDTSLVAKYSTPAAETYSSATTLAYAEIPEQTFYSVAKPEGLEDVKVIFNRLAAPSVELTKNIDFWVRDSVITVRDNPFDNPRIPKRTILSGDGTVTDRECVLWLYRGQWDWDTVYEQFGYALRLKLKSSQGYKDFINAIFDAFVAGTSVRTQAQALAAAFGIPLVVEAEETVESIVNDADKLNIITDAHVYQFPIGTTPVVSVGDVVRAGDPVTNLFQTFEFNRGTIIDPADISALSIGSGVLAWGFWGDLTWENQEEAVLVEEGVDGYTKVSWNLGGFPFDTEKFWDDVHTAGVAANETLAMLLDGRENPTGQPTANSLPTTVNPLQFLVDNLLRNNAYVVKVKPGGQLSNQLAFVPVAQLRKIQPPHTLMMIIVELVYADSPVIMDGPGTAAVPGYEETVGGFPCMVISETLDPATYVTERVRTSTIGGRCI
jgi:hypothetical protein